MLRLPSRLRLYVATLVIACQILNIGIVNNPIVYGATAAPSGWGSAAATLQVPQGAWRGAVELSGSIENYQTGQSVILMVDGGVVASQNSPQPKFSVDTTGLQDGPHLVIMSVNEGDRPVAQTNVQVTIDNTSPIVVNASQIGSSLPGDEIQIQVAVSDQGSGIAEVVLELPDSKINMQPVSPGVYSANLSTINHTTPYQIRISDQAGNELTWSDDDRAQIVVTELPTPLNLNATLRNDQKAIELTWSLPDALPDGASYCLYRSTSGSSPEVIATVKDPYFVDTDISAASYEYYVQTEARSGSESDKSQRYVITVEGQAETTTPQNDTAMETDTTLSDSGDLLSASTNVVEAMTSTSLGGTISSNTTLDPSGSPYVVTSSLTVASGVTLTIQPGTILKFNTGTYLRVNGTVQAIGEETNPIILTSTKDDANGGDTNGDGSATTPAAGNWNYVEIPTGGTVSFQYTHVLYGGYTNASLYGSGGSLNATSVVIRKSSTRGIQLTQGQIINSTIEDFATTGIYISSGNPVVSGNTISGGSYGIFVNAGSPTVSGNTIAGGTYGISVNAGSPSVSGNTLSGSTYGIYLTAGTSTLSSNEISGGNYGIYVSAGNPEVLNNTISGSNSAGVFYSGYTNDVSGTFQGNSISQTKAYAVDISLSGKCIGALSVADNTFTGNPYNGYGLTGSFGGTSTLPVLSYPYISHGVTINTAATVNVQAGTVFKIASGNLTVNGMLNVTGDTVNQAVFTSIKDDNLCGDSNNDGSTTTPQAGDWGSIDVTTSGTGTFTQTRFLYGGKSTASLNSSGGVIQADNILVRGAVKGVQLGSGRLVNSTLDNLSTSGIQVSGGTPEVRGNTVNGGNYGIYISGGSPSIIDKYNHQLKYGGYLLLWCLQ